MNDHDYHNGVPLGTAGLRKLMDYARPSMESSDSSERFYDLARSVTMLLIRSGREEREVQTWREFFRHISGLALALRKDYQSAKFDYLLQMAHRFETLDHLLGDQNMWRSAYELPQVLELPHVHKTIVFLSNKHRITMEAYLDGLGIRHETTVSILAELRLLTWEEDEAGVVRLSLTEAGTQLALSLLARAE